ncbi:hypothetical protein B0E44_04035 [Flavobacterium sp. A45]|nr:hypothetical protein B0E44_04035 [Flavobacterium sp. A45]
MFLLFDYRFCFRVCKYKDSVSYTVCNFKFVQEYRLIFEMYSVFLILFSKRKPAALKKVSGLKINKRTG